MAATAHGHYALASYYLANGDDHANEEIRAILVSDLERYEAYGTSVRSFPQHIYIILALSIGDRDLAKSIAALPIERKNWSTFDAYVTHRICKLMGIQQSEKEPRFSPTKSEEGFVKALNALAQGKEFSPVDVESFWKSLRKKRFQFTIFEHQNLFEPALRALGNAAQPGSQPDAAR